MKHIKLPVISILCLLAALPSQAQQKEIPCYTDEILEQKLRENPSLQDRQAAFHKTIDAHRDARTKRDGEGCEVRIIPVVFHIVHQNGRENISDETVQDYVDEVNDAFRFNNVSIDDVDTAWHSVLTDMKIEIRLAQYDPEGNPTTGIVRHESSITNASFSSDNVKTVEQWDPDSYLNIYVVRSIRGNTNGTILGYAYFPFMENETKSNSGIVIRSDVLGRQTLPHELGHYLGLYHPFQDGCGPSVNYDCRRTGDRVCDTPPTNRNENNCPRGRNSCSNDSPDQYDMLENIMDYTSCRNIFTKGQKEVVDIVFKEDRPELIAIDNLYETGVLDSNESIGEPIADFQSDFSNICEGSTISFEDRSCTDIKNTDYKWFFPSGTPSAAFEPNPEVSYSRSGTYDVTLIISNESGADTIERKAFVNVYPKVSELKAPYHHVFADTSFPYPQWTAPETISGDKGWQYVDSFGKDGLGCLGIQNHNKERSGQEIIFSLPPVDMTEAKISELSFDLAYARKSTASQERLQVYVNDACLGVSSLRYDGRSSSIETTGSLQSEAFFPESDDWKQVLVNLGPFTASTALSIEFRFTSFGEQNIYLDNVMLGSWPLSLQEKQEHAIKIFPNPASQQLNISGISASSTLRIYNMAGAEVFKTQTKGQENLLLDVSAFGKGFYLVEVENKKGRFKEKLMLR